MKRNFAVIIAIIIVVVIAVSVWYFSPVYFLNNIDKNEISVIDVFDGGTGQSFFVGDENEIAYIFENIGSIAMKRDKLSHNYDGNGFYLSFKNAQGEVIDEVVVNSNDTIRDDPFFYKSDSKEICFEYLKILEAQYADSKFSHSGENDDGRFWFDAVVIELSEGSLLVAPYKGTREYRSANKIYVPAEMKSLLSLNKGDTIRIIYNGTIAESYPAQIFTVYSIEKIDIKTIID